ncbi:hypothetical protein [Legionella bononiensis]|uniref:Uncharacterized protein n=1 Tax=Legionella bononiensis TaxID=2793102 RepID=A0ABS1WCI7_9GAMM|nr:hypothetical protein [Legionella bononiensis]MBL7478939.1 hypothetical protein [Legionella bononiensis]MBL7527071.1 hypothetical protein [Legionella bononiensis]MBL7562040.1 hypothetical protein [Legionella bononiensis]
MDEKRDKLLVKNDVALPPRARSIEEVQPIRSDDVSLSNKVVLVQKIKDQRESGQRSAYFLKHHNAQSGLAELEAYCGAICQFIATSRYVPNTRPYFDRDGIVNRVSSKAMVGFRSNYDVPLCLNDFLISSPEIDTEFRQRSLILCTENLLNYYNTYNPSGGFKYYASLSFVSSWLKTTPTQYATRNVLLQSLNNPGQSSMNTSLNALKQRRDYLMSQAARAPDFLNEYYQLNQAIRQLKTFKTIGSIKEPLGLSIKVLEQLDRIVKTKGIDLDQCGQNLSEEIDGIQYTVPTRDLKNYRTIKGLGVGWSTRYIFKEGDGHNSDSSKDGIILDFDWTKANILYDYRSNDVFNQLLRHSDSVEFACNEYNMEHFPDIDEPNLFYWPTKQPDLRDILLTNFAQVLAVIDKEVVESNVLFNLIPIHLILATFDYIENDYLEHNNKTYFEQISDFFHSVYLKLNRLITNQPIDQVDVKEKIRHFFKCLIEKVSQLADLIYLGVNPLDARTIGAHIKVAERYLASFFVHYQELRTNFITFSQGPLFKEVTGIESPDEQWLEKMLQHSDGFIRVLKDQMEILSLEFHKRYDHFERNSYTVEDNTNYKLLAGHPVFIFHKYKTFLKYILTDPEIFRVLAELNIAEDPASAASSSSNTSKNNIHDKLVTDEKNRIQEIRNTLVSMPDFKRFLKEHGQFAFDLIKEEFATERDKYSKKTKNTEYYERLVQALDLEHIESKFNELCKVCEADDHDISSEDDMLYSLYI